MYSIRWDQEPDVEEYRRLHALFENDPERALNGFEALAARGSFASTLYLASEYMKAGAARREALSKVKYWLLKSDEGGSALASYMLGAVCSRLNEYDEAFRSFSRGAARNYLPAIYRLAIMHKEGHRIPRDINQCRALLEVAASRGHMFAKRDLATIYIKGTFGPILIMKGALMLFDLLFVVLIFCAKSVTQGPEAVIYDERVLT